MPLFLRDEDSYAAFTRLFHHYSELSGALLNRGKSKALRFGSFASNLRDEVQWLSAVKVLGVNFLASGDVSQETWTRLAVAARFRLSLADRAFVIRASVSAALLFVARGEKHWARKVFGYLNMRNVDTK